MSNKEVYKIKIKCWDPTLYAPKSYKYKGNFSLTKKEVEKIKNKEYTPDNIIKTLSDHDFYDDDTLIWNCVTKNIIKKINF